MNYRYIYALAFLVILSSNSLLYSQNISGTLNGAYRIDKQSSGYSLFIEYTLNLNKKIGLKVGLGQSYTTSRRPQEMDGYMVGGIRDYNTLNPYGANFFRWTEKNFPGINLPTKDNKYFKLDLFIALNNLIHEGNFSVSPGIVISYKDVQEIVRYIKAEKIDNFFGPTVFNQLIPVYNYGSIIKVVEKEITLSSKSDENRSTYRTSNWGNSTLVC